MSVDSALGLLIELGQHKLLPAVQLDVLRAESDAYPTVRQLADHLVSRDWLTRFQIDEVLAGRGNLLQLGQYRLLARIGEGGMGVVYKARHAKLNRIAAVKVMRANPAKRDTFQRRFEREMQAVARLNHPNVVMLFDTGEHDGTLFFGMEYVEGVDLERMVLSGGRPLGFEQAAEFIRQAALGLQHAHECGLVHRDIKPSNLLVSKLTAPHTYSVQVGKSMLKGVAKRSEEDSWGPVKILAHAG